MTGPSARARMPLAARLALILAGGVMVVLLLSGTIVNRVVSGGFERLVGQQQEVNVALAAEELAALDGWGRGREDATVRFILRRAVPGGGRAQLFDASGRTVTQIGGRGGGPPGPRQQIEQPVTGPDGSHLGLLVVQLPADRGAPDQGFLTLFNRTLVLTGVLAVGLLLAYAGITARRLTMPLGRVTEAARRLGSGDLGARAPVGDDRESTELADAFNRMAERLERSEQLRRRAASDVAHDLATPAMLVESQLQAMLDGVVVADRDQLERARSAAAAMNSLIARLGELASAEAAPLQRRTERLDLRDVVGEAAAALGGLFAERSVLLVVDPGHEPLPVDADRAQLERALRNVLTNAAQHSPPGSRVSVALTTGEDGVELRVSDEGSGIDPDDLPHLFERFYRADRSRAGGAAGAGIGLTIARELLAANGGRISVEHSGPAGSTFLIWLPATPAGRA
jgi:two-component system, OmpR family, sensor histidine kinase BaeS